MIQHTMQLLLFIHHPRLSAVTIPGKSRSELINKLSKEHYKHKATNDKSAKK